MAPGEFFAASGGADRAIRGLRARAAAAANARQEFGPDSGRRADRPDYADAAKARGSGKDRTGGQPRAADGIGAGTRRHTDSRLSRSGRATRQQADFFERD